MTISAAKTTTKPTIEESLLPPKIMTALSMVASGTSYELAAKSVNMTANQLRKWNKHKDTKDFYLKKVGELVVKNKSLYMQLADAMYVEFGFDRTSGTFSDYIQEPKHVTYIQTWFDAYVND